MDMSSICFSEDCTSSTIHQLVQALTNILKSVFYENKVSGNSNTKRLLFAECN